jgi:hypothetical protein
VAEPLIQYEDGWTGGFTRRQAEDAIANGSKVVKVQGEPGDGTELGTVGTVLGSLAPNDSLIERFGQGERWAAIFYFVEWDTKPRVAVGVLGWKIAPVDDT